MHWRNEPGAEALRSKMVLRMLHRSFYGDKLSSRMTRRERRLHTEVYASKEPEVI